MKILIKKEQTGLHNYSNVHGCPIACGLKNAGFTDVLVGSDTWHGSKIETKKFLFLFKKEYYIQFKGKISAEANGKAQDLSRNKQLLDITLELN